MTMPFRRWRCIANVIPAINLAMLSKVVVGAPVVRQAACEALGQVFYYKAKTAKRNDIRPETFKALLENLSYAGSKEVREAAGNAFGKMPIPPAERLAIFRQVRIND